MYETIPLSILCVVVFTLLGCPQGEAVCEPGETQLCTCAAGAEGGQVCAEDGQRWEACDCGEGDDDDGDDDDTADVEDGPLDNPFLGDVEASFETWDLPELTCPDGGTPSVFVAYADDISTPAPMALLLHPGSFDYLDSLGVSYSSQVYGEERLTADWAKSAVRSVLGIGKPLGAYIPGTLVATLISEGFYVVAPTNCWGDLWHGQGDNDAELEGFSRHGLEAAQASLQEALAQLQVDEERLLLAGLGEGGRGIVDLVIQGWSDTPILIDSSPDYLPPIFGDPANDAYLEGLERIYAEGDLNEYEFRPPDMGWWSGGRSGPRLDPAHAEPHAEVRAREAGFGLVEHAA